MDAITESLLENSNSAIMGCIELHNKPNFSYRYEVCVILAINAWELMLKAYINENRKEIRLINKDGISKPFDDCVKIVSDNEGKNFRTTEENLNSLYKFRCQIIHFYKDNIDAIIFSLLHTSILLYNDFSKKQFNIDLSEKSNLILLPIGFNPIYSPIDFLSNKSYIKKTSLFVQNFIEEIIVTTNKLLEEGVSEAILSTFNMSVINENRTTNADIIAGITKDEESSKLSVNNILNDVKITENKDAKEIRISEDSLFKTKYVLTYKEVTDRCREIFSDFKQNSRFNLIMKGIKKQPNLYKKRYLDAIEQSGSGKDYYSNEIFDELAKHYTRSQ